MPKETIRAEGFDVEVTWGRERESVQVASVIRPPAVGNPQTADQPASLGALLDSWGPEERFTTRGLHATIATRQDVNDLIRVLRRARDQAFGRDE